MRPGDFVQPRGDGEPLPGHSPPSPPGGESCMHRAILRPFDGFAKRLVCRCPWSLGILAPTPRHPLAHGFEGHTRLTARRGQGRAASQRDGDRHLHGHVQLRRSASRARVYGPVQIRHIHAWGSLDAWTYEMASPRPSSWRISALRCSYLGFLLRPIRKSSFSGICSLANFCSKILSAMLLASVSPGLK